MAASRPIRVLHLLKTSVGANWALRQMRYLAALGVDVHVALPAGPLVREYEAAGIHTHTAQFELDMRRPQMWPRLFRDLRALVAYIKPDLIHSHFVSTTLTMRLALGKKHCKPRIFQIPGPLHLEHYFYRTAEIATAGPPDYWVGSCRWTRERYLRSGIAPHRVFLSYYGIDLKGFVPGTPGKLRSELGLTKESKIVGMVSYMYAPKGYLGQTRGLKGHEDLIDALALMRPHRLDVVGVFAGGAWNNAIAYEKRVRAYGLARLGDHAIFLGTRSDVADLYADFDVVVHPSHSENVGGAAESLLLAVPTIATNVGGFPDLVIPGKTGWLVPPRRPDKLAGAILDVLRDPVQAHRLAQNGRQCASELFDLRRTAAGIQKIYHEIMAWPGFPNRKIEL